MVNEKQNFTHFKIHTQYSICEGAIKIVDLAKFCKENKIRSIGISDSFNLCGALEFSEEISKVGTQPIIGSQINFKFQNIIGKIPVFASTEKGFNNLTKLSSKSYLDVDHSMLPHCSLNELLNNNDGLIITSGSLDSLFNKLLQTNNLKHIEEFIFNIKNTFSDRFYFEIQRHNDIGERSFENSSLNYSKKFKIPLIASQEVFYLEHDMFEAHDALICIGEKTYIDEKNRKRYSKEHYLKTFADLKNIYQDLPEALENNYNFPFRFSYKLKKSKPNLPSIKILSDLTENEELLSLSKKGLENRLKNYVFKQKKIWTIQKLKKFIRIG